jgi:hypothetical protein
VEATRVPLELVRGRFSTYEDCLECQKSSHCFSRREKAANSRDNAITHVDGTVDGTTPSNRRTCVVSTREPDEMGRLTDLS